MMGVPTVSRETSEAAAERRDRVRRGLTNHPIGITPVRWGHPKPKGPSGPRGPRGKPNGAQWRRVRTSPDHAPRKARIR